MSVTVGPLSAALDFLHDRDVSATITVEGLATRLLDVQEDLVGWRLVATTALTHLHEATVEQSRLRDRLAEVREELRQARQGQEQVEVS